MNKRILRALATLLVALLWTALLLFQHISCFDVFETNAWYLYVLAVLFTCLQHIALYVAVRHSLFGRFFVFFGAAYIILAFGLALQLLTHHAYAPYPIGLTVLCLGLDAVSGLLVFVWRKNGLIR